MAEKLSEEQVRAMFQVNNILDDMVEKVVDGLRPALEALPSMTARLALLNKLDRALQHLREEVRKEP